MSPMPDNGKLTFQFKKIHDTIVKGGNRLFQENGITMAQAHVLICLDQLQDHMASFKQLEKIFMVSQPTMAGIVGRLEKKGLVSTAADPADKRAKIVSLSNSGMKICKQAKASIDRVDQVIEDSLSNDEKNELRRLLVKVQDNLTQKIKVAKNNDDEQTEQIDN